MRSALNDIKVPLLAENEGKEILIVFKPTAIGLEYLGNRVVGVHSQAAKAGVKVDWTITAVNNSVMPNDSTIINNAIHKTYDEKKVTLISFINTSNKKKKGSYFEIENNEDPGIGRRVESEFMKFHRSRDLIVLSHGGRSHYPFFTYGLIFTCTVIFIAEIGNNGWVFESFSNNPLLGPSVKTVQKMGAKDTLLIVNNGEWYRLISAIFLHGGIIHLAINMATLWKISGDMERAFGFKATTSLFFLSGIFSMIISAIFVPFDLTVGSSGAIFGMFGSCWADFIQNYEAIQNKGIYCACMVLTTFVCFGFGLLPWLDNFLHIGGFICGLACGLVVYLQRRYVNENKQTYKRYQIVNRIFGMVAVVVMFVFALIALVMGFDPQGWCKWCQYLSCFKTKFWHCAKAP